MKGVVGHQVKLIKIQKHSVVQGKGGNGQTRHSQEGEHQPFHSNEVLMKNDIKHTKGVLKYKDT